jgi:hypothetical protein
MVTYLEATTTKTATELQSEWTDAMAAGDPAVTLTGFSPTSAERGLIALEARAIAREQEIRREVVLASLLVNVQQRDPAWIDRFVEGFFKVTRLRRTKARHLFTLTNQTATGGPYTIKPAGAAGAGISLEASSIDGTRFVNTEGGTLQAGAGATLVVEFEAMNAGTSGNIAPGEIFKIQGGALPGVDIANPAESQTRVARDDETNVEYVTRALARWGSLAAGGHNGAAIFRILSGVETLTKIGIADDNPNGQSSVDVYLANSTGPATNDECLAAAAVFGPYEPLGSRGRWRYLPALARIVTATATLELDGTNPEAVADAEAALAFLAAVWPMKAGKKLDESLLRGIVRGGAYEEFTTQDPETNEAIGVVGFRGVADVDMTAPLDDIVLDVGEVLVIVPNLTAI